MKLSDSDADRLLAGQVPTDHSDLTQVAAFFSTLPDTYPPAKVGPERDEHLYAVTREARLLAATTPARSRRSTRRLVVTALAAGLGVLTTGVGVAAAVGANPLSFLPNLLPEPAISARADTPASLNPDDTGSADHPSPPQPTNQPQTSSSTETSPASAASTAKSTNGKSDEAKSNNGKSDEAKATHKPTSKATHTNNGKSGEKSNNGKATAKSTTSSNARTDPPGKTKSDD